MGCSYENFKQHLENKFAEGMTWNNHGDWHMDHIYPVSRAIDEEHLIKLNHMINEKIAASPKSLSNRVEKSKPNNSSDNSDLS